MFLRVSFLISFAEIANCFGVDSQSKLVMMPLPPQLIIQKETECKGKFKSRGTFCNKNVTSCRETR